MAATYPGVFVCQFIAAPVVALVLAVQWLFWKTVEPGAATTTSSPIVITVSLIAALFVVCLLGAMSLIGLYEGWRIGWTYGSGMQVRDVLVDAAPVRWFRGILGKLRVRG
jgi:hypothetical protein